MGFPSGAVAKKLPANAGNTRDMGLIPGSGRSHRGGNGNLLQYSCLGNPKDGGLQSIESQRMDMTENAFTSYLSCYNRVAAETT